MRQLTMPGRYGHALWKDFLHGGCEHSRPSHPSPLDLIHHRRIQQRTCIPQRVQFILRHLPQYPSHDLPAAGLRQAAHELDLVGLRDAADPVKAGPPCMCTSCPVDQWKFALLVHVPDPDLQAFQIE